MASRQREDLPAALRRAGDQFAAWRQTRRHGTRIPASLWKLAARVALKHGVARTARVLSLDYYVLRERVTPSNTNAKSRSLCEKAEFVELPVSSVATSGECIVVFEDGRGGRLQVHMKGCQAPDLVTLGRDFWNAQSCFNSRPR